jgi:hypothetical protein
MTMLVGIVEDYAALPLFILSIVFLTGGMWMRKSIQVRPESPTATNIKA